MGKWKCLWCSKVLEGESFMDLIAASEKEEGGQHVHGWESIHLVEKDVAAPAPVVKAKNELDSFFLSVPIQRLPI